MGCRETGPSELNENDTFTFSGRKVHYESMVLESKVYEEHVNLYR